MVTAGLNCLSCGSSRKMTSSGCRSIPPGRRSRTFSANPAFSLLVLDLLNPFRYLELRGDAELAPDPDYTFAAKVGAKYGTDLRDMDEPGESRVVVTLRASRIRAWG